MARGLSEEHWRRLEPVLDRVLELTPPERASLLDQACSDGALTRDDADWILRELARSGALLDSGALERFTAVLAHEDESPDILPTLAGALKERYVIDRKVGEGGMATVYLARDLKLRRQVAIKVLRPRVAALLGAARFLQEIEVTARLDHPYILALLDSGEAAGLLYYVMPYVEGETLRDRLGRETPLSFAEATRIALEVSDALEYAHSREIIHRDIKPDNILLAGGHARVADFGIARALTTASADSAPQTGPALGTLAYMSPEQKAGDSSLDARTDIYSLGCVLREMLGAVPGGRPPMQESHAEIAAIVARATAPERDRRFASAGELGRALSAAGARPRMRMSKRARVVAGVAIGVAVAAGASAPLWPGSLSPPKPLNADVIAVLPFRISGPDSSLDYLREGALDLLHAQLNGDKVPRAVDNLAILRAYDSATTAVGGELDVAQSLEVARRFGAGRAMLGRVTFTPGARLADATIYDVASGQPVASHNESAPSAVDALALLNRVLAKLLAQGIGESATRLGTLSDSMSAVRLYLDGIKALRRADRSAYATFDRALAIDTGFAAAALWATLDDGMDPDTRDRRTRAAWRLRNKLAPRDRALLLAHYGIGPNYPDTSSMRQMLLAGERAAHLNPDRAEVWYDHGSYMLIHGPQAFDDGPRRAAVLLDSAIALDSSLAPALQWRLETALTEGNRDDIKRFAKLSVAASPTAPMTITLNWVAAQARRDADALRSASAMLATLRPSPIARLGKEAAVHGISLAEAEREIEARMRVTHPDSFRRAVFHNELFFTESVRGKVGEALARVDSMGDFAYLVLYLALAEPGYDSAVAQGIKPLLSIVDTTSDPNPACEGEMWRTRAGDTSRTRRTIERLRELTKDYSPAASPGVGRFGICSLLLSAMLERMRGRDGDRRVLDTLERVITDGAGIELPGNLATLYVARWRDERGEFHKALKAVRRRPIHHNGLFSIMLPAHLQLEAELAAILGDTVGAIRAYKHFLAIRDDPDPGLKAAQVRRVRLHLAELEASRSPWRRATQWIATLFERKGLRSRETDVIAVLPFRVTAEDSSYNYLREGSVTLLSAQLTGEGAARAVDGGLSLSRWRRETATSDGALSDEQSRAFARRLGATQVLDGTFMATANARTVSARLVSVADGRLIAEHVETGIEDPLVLLRRLAGRLIARSTGEGSSRLPTLSDSPGALKEYVAGVRAFYRHEHFLATAHFNRALEIDSNFAVAALWQTLTDGRNNDQERAHAARAWKLRDRLSARDRSILAAGLAIGPNYPGISSTREQLDASSRAAKLNPDRPEVWFDYGAWMLVFGRQFHDDWLQRAVAALDSAMVLDPEFGPAVRWRFEAALPSGNAAEIRRLAVRNEEVNATGDFIRLDRALAATALGGYGVIDPPDDFAVWFWYIASIVHGFSLKEVESSLRKHIQTIPSGSPRIGQMESYLWTIEAARGRASPPPASLVRRNPGSIIHVALADTQFAPTATEAAAELESSSSTPGNANRLCYRELWRVYNGDTSSARSTIAEITELVRPQDPAPFPRVGRFGVCTRLIAAMVEARGPPRGARPALDDLESLMREGTGIELPTTLATLFLVRQRSALGEHRRAYDLARRIPFHRSPATVIATPALLREEGRLAMIIGDPAAAIRAYRRYLVLRDDAAGGPLAKDVAQVARELSTLVTRQR